MTPVLVLDRINPIAGNQAEGPMLQAGFESFVGGAAIPLRHGLTLGELALLMRFQHGIKVDLSVLPVRRWRRDNDWLDMNQHWLAPSPNLPSPSSLWIYPGGVMTEGTNLSEGRGTTTPFEVIGAPWIDPIRFSRRLQDAGLTGVRLLPNRFCPSFDKHGGRSCGGVSIHVTDPSAFRPCRTAITVLAAAASMYPDDFRWLDPPYEYEYNLPPIDIISGNDRLRRLFARGVGSISQDDLTELLAVGNWWDTASDFLLYE